MKNESHSEAFAEDFDICPYCGASNKPGSRKCQNCGEDIEEGDVELL